ncbi:plasmid transfer ATPase TraJ (plasmid) [Candidatus Fukatsuia symbiotica]|uniref:Plasmid transfer ATPase TraJ n=1 Tax=Candidatus Fukatsuia symbiotica TaxID=1878942 RepID=A0A2Y9CKG9_9GAMM|nr:plasmid transfer ATPase TraJ [Candidatus Fukatsuia symbiotica]AWK15499.1 plasmid transfer ATPase TraJ [Candidatus Fukatsuia symbiotica]MEA9445891.1 plasmid transfer ATPase TraJ [Candidatus Fukatsuia symbiotica]
MSADSLPPFDFSAGLSADTLRRFFTWCARHNVTDIHLQGGSPLIVGRYGRLVKASAFRLEDAQLTKLIDEIFTPKIKAMVKSGRGVDRALQLDGDADQRYGLSRGERLRFRANFIQVTAGRQELTMAVTLRLIPTHIPALESLDLEPDLLRHLLPHKGLILVCGETGSGKSTLLAAIYQYCCRLYTDRKIVTFEDPIEYILGTPENLLPPAQSQIGRDVGSFAEGLKLALRQAPDVIGVGEIRDRETLSGAIACGQSGHLCLSTLHTHSPGETIPRAVLMFPAEMREAAARDLLGVLQVIVVQQLLRTTDGKRQAIREYLIFDEAVRRELACLNYTQWSHWIDSRLQAQQARLADKAWQLYQTGRIPRDEMLNVVSHGELEQRERDRC